MNVTHDRHADDGSIIVGESLYDTTVRLERIISAPPEQSRPQPFTVPPEDRDPDAPPGWYDEPSMDALWLPGSMRGN